MNRSHMRRARNTVFSGLLCSALLTLSACGAAVGGPCEYRETEVKASVANLIIASEDGEPMRASGVELITEEGEIVTLKGEYYDYSEPYRDVTSVKLLKKTRIKGACPKEVYERIED